ncbi:MAG TPA: flagellar filament outer layer protein FlaA [Treponemataceae bacterium]|nr:flagellar filament outer layer protein FlaA [Treponemataceae bacterium]
MKKIIAICAVLASAALVFAQGVTSLSDPDPTMIGDDTGKMALREVSVDLFEREGQWNSRMSADSGLISGRLFEGGSASKEPLEDVDNQQRTDDMVYGVKAEFFKRGVNSFYVTSARPLPVEGVTKVISVWVCGRNKPHDLSLLVRDYYGNNFELWLGSLQFSGWKKMQVAVPPTQDGRRGIVQSSEYHGDRPGLSVIGFRVDCDPEYAIGSYYLYFDDMRAITDLYSIEHRDPDDMDDNW